MSAVSTPRRGRALQKSPNPPRARGPGTRLARSRASIPNAGRPGPAPHLLRPAGCPPGRPPLKLERARPPDLAPSPELFLNGSPPGGHDEHEGSAEDGLQSLWREEEPRTCGPTAAHAAHVRPCRHTQPVCGGARCRTSQQRSANLGSQARQRAGRRVGGPGRRARGGGRARGGRWTRRWRRAKWRRRGRGRRRRTRGAGELVRGEGRNEGAGGPGRTDDDAPDDRPRRKALPPKLLQHVGKKLPGDDVLACALTCRTWGEGLRRAGLLTHTSAWHQS